MSIWKLLYDQFDAQGSLPNRLSIAIGEKIRQTREEAKMSQEELAQAIYRRRASLSEMERGKMYPDIETLIYLAHVFQKPLLYFIPNFAYPHTESGNTLTDDQQELLVHFGKLDADGKRLALALLRTHANFGE